MEIHTLEDLLYHFPRRYLDRRKLSRIGDVRIGEETTVVGTVRSAELNRISRNRSVLHVAIFDGSAYMYGVWFNQPYHADKLQPDTEVAFSGRVQYRYGRLQMINPAYDILEDPAEVGMKTVHTGRIIPLHPATQKMSAAMLRRLIMRALEQYGDLPDHIPYELRLRYGYPHRAQALREMHFPGSSGRLNRARQRMAYDELLVMQVALALRRQRLKSGTPGIAHAPPGRGVSSFIASLPFTLTAAQQRAFEEISADMAFPYPMNRLLAGGGGLGKDGGGAAGAAADARERPPGGDNGPHRGTGGTALRQYHGYARPGAGGAGGAAHGQHHGCQAQRDSGGGSETARSISWWGPTRSYPRT